MATAISAFVALRIGTYPTNKKKPWQRKRFTNSPQDGSVKVVMNCAPGVRGTQLDYGKRFGSTRFWSGQSSCGKNAGSRSKGCKALPEARGELRQRRASSIPSRAASTCGYLRAAIPDGCDPAH